MAWSYPPDTFALAEQAKIEGLNVKAFYSAVAVAFPSYYAKYGKSVENACSAPVASSIRRRCGPISSATRT